MFSYTSSDGLNLAFHDDGGDGLPLLCLPGLTRNSSDFEYLIGKLPDVRLIRPDYRGRGASDWADYKTYTPVQEAQDILALMDHLGLAKAALLGTSRGGIISMILAASAKDRLRGVCLNDIGPEVAPAGLANIMTYLGRDPAAKTYGEAAAARARIMQGMFTDVSRERWLSEVRNFFIQVPGGLKINYDPSLRTAVEDSGASATPDLWPLFDALADLPTALIHGDHSDILSHETAREMRRRRPDMIYALVPGRGHVPFLDEVESLAALIGWLEQMQ